MSRRSEPHTIPAPGTPHDNPRVPGAVRKGEHAKPTVPHEDRTKYDRKRVKRDDPVERYDPLDGMGSGY